MIIDSVIRGVQTAQHSRLRLLFAGSIFCLGGSRMEWKYYFCLHYSVISAITLGGLPWVIGPMKTSEESRTVNQKLPLGPFQPTLLSRVSLFELCMSLIFHSDSLKILYFSFRFKRVGSGCSRISCQCSWPQ